MWHVESIYRNSDGTTTGFLSSQNDETQEGALDYALYLTSGNKVYTEKVRVFKCKGESCECK